MRDMIEPHQIWAYPIAAVLGLLEGRKPPPGNMLPEYLPGTPYPGSCFITTLPRHQCIIRPRQNLESNMARSNFLYASEKLLHFQR